MFVKQLFKLATVVVCTVTLLGMTPAIAASDTPVKAKQIVPIEHWSTKNGVRVFFVASHQVPIVDIGVMFDAGSARDGKQFGVASMAFGLLDEGTKARTSNQVASGFESVGAKFSSSVSKDFASISLRSLSQPQFFDKAVDVFTDVLNHPTFPERHVKRVRQQMLRRLERQQQEPSSIASKAFFKALYANQPYGHPTLGTLETVKKLDRNDVEGFYRRYINAQNALIVIVGDIKRPDAEALAEKIVGKLPMGQKAAAVQFTNGQSHGEVNNIRFPSAQTHIVIGQRSITRKSPEYFPLMVGNQILGGGILTSRLYENVREKEGLAYSVYSHFSPMVQRGPFVIGLQTRNKQANKAISIVEKTLKKFIDDGPTQEELSMAKNGITNGFVLRLATNRSILGNVMMIAFYDLPIDYLDTYKSHINAVTAEEIKAVFQKTIKPKKLVTITVGNNVY